MPNPMGHWELMVNDPERAKTFYRRVFDWRFDDEAFPGYTIIHTGEPPGGGLIAKPPGAPMPALNTYFLVDSVNATLRNVVEAGGTVIVPRTEIPHVGAFAMFLDPDRIPLGILEQKR